MGNNPFLDGSRSGTWVPSYAPLDDGTRGTKKAWVLRRKQDGKWVYWAGQVKGFITDLAKAEQYDKKPSAMGDEEAVQVRIEVTLD